MLFEPDLYQLRKIFELNTLRIKKGTLWDDFLWTVVWVRVDIRVNGWNSRKVYLTPILNQYVELQLPRSSWREETSPKHLILKLWGKSWNPQKAHLGLIVNLHTKLKIPISIWRGAVRGTNSKYKKTIQKFIAATKSTCQFQLSSSIWRGDRGRTAWLQGQKTDQPPIYPLSIDLRGWWLFLNVIQLWIVYQLVQKGTTFASWAPQQLLSQFWG